VPDLISFPLDGDDAVLVEVDLDRPEIGPVSRAGDLVRSAAMSFDGALAHIRKAASIALANFRDAELRPDEVQIEFGVALNAQAGAVIARTGVDGHLKVQLTWRRTDAAGPTEETETRGGS
jgi:Trypsin-co-occurring domain 1